MRGKLQIVLAAIAVAAVALGFGQPELGTTVRAAASNLESPNEVCAGCHQAIYDKYERTGMARGSGIATNGLIPGGFRHTESGVEYRVFAREGDAWMSYRRAAADPKGALAGERRLEYYVGSGHRGRTYLYQDGGQWFELPINHYTRRNAWDMAPAFDHVERMPGPLPVDPNCLHCHATAVQTAAVSARSRYQDGPFRQGGVGCSACHGDPAAHLAELAAGNGHDGIVNPSKLDAVRRDSVCLQCHLEGDAVVYKPGKSLAQFRAGDALGEFAVYFVRKQQLGGGERATSQYEALLRSACKRAAGDKLTCTTCHDPHSEPAAADRVPFYRAKCLACHTAPAMARHHAEQQDCAICHMPSRNTTDISHEQVTDHDIESRPRSVERAVRASDLEMIPVGAFAADDRSLGVAYAQMAERGAPGAASKALRLLAGASAAGNNDAELNKRLGYLRQATGDAAGARKAYAAALASDPWNASALGNLAVLDAQQGRLREAIALLDRLVTNDPSQTAAGLNLAFIECRLERKEEAAALVKRLLEVNPDDAALREFVFSGDYNGQSCRLAQK
jgi:tetratricopeptide (TPR) repeat protein